MRTFGTGGRLADVEARIGAEMRAASAESWIITDVAGFGDATTRCCCALGSVGRDKLIEYIDDPINRWLDGGREVRHRLALDRSEYSDIASGFDGETFDPDTNEWVHLGRRLRVLGDELNAARGAA